MKFFDDKNKNLKWYNRNYFYIGTIMIVLINVLLFVVLGNSWDSSIISVDNFGHWEDPFYFNSTIASFFNAFSHANLQHVLLNMLCFAVCGIYLERKTGTLGILGFVVFSAYISGIAVTCNDLSVAWHGFSGVNFFLYAYIIFDFFFSFRKDKKNRTNIILGSIVLLFIYVAMCFSEGVSGFGFKIYPYDLIYNMGHYSSFLMGCAVSLFKNIVEISAKKSVKNNNYNS